MHSAHRLIYKFLGVFVILGMVLAASPRRLLAEEPTATPTPGPGVPILPVKPTRTPTPTSTFTPLPPKIQFLIANSYTAPQQPRAQEPFDLRLEIRNTGNGTANGYTIRVANCVTGDFWAEDGCIKPLPDLAPGQGAWVMFRLRLIAPLDDQGVKDATLQIADAQSKDLDQGLGNMTVRVNFLPSWPIEDEAPNAKRPFPGPDIAVGKSWTAKARSTVAELLTPVPVRLDATPPGGGGPEFELVVELHNQGQVEATNIFVDFCGGTDFNPVGSMCRKFVPASLPPGAKAVASQTLAYKNNATPVARGAEAQLTITYEFWQGGQWLRAEAKPKVYIYPQEYPAPLLPPYTAPQLTVNVDGLNVRLGPGTAYPAVGALRRGDQFDVIGKTEAPRWWQIVFAGRAAWVSGQAAYVTVRGGESVPVALSTPPLPVAQTSAAAADARSAPAGQAAASAAIAATATLTPTATAVAASESGRPADVPAPSAPSADAANLNRRSAQPWVVIERYRATPQQPVEGQPFTLELTLRNPGRQTATQLAVGWRSNQIAPFGAGGVRWLGDLLPGATVTFSGQFLVTDPRPLGMLQLPVEFTYGDEAGRSYTTRDEITLLRPTARPTIAPAARDAATAPAGRAQPRWFSALLGFLGLGGGQR